MPSAFFLLATCRAPTQTRACQNRSTHTVCLSHTILTQGAYAFIGYPNPSRTTVTTVP